MLSTSPKPRTAKPAKCRFCKLRLEKVGQKLHDDCVGPWWVANQEKVKAKAAAKAKKAKRLEKSRDRVKREADKGVPELIALADTAFFAFIRARDKLAKHPCISSGKPLNWANGRLVNAGHYRSRGAASHLRYNEDNCHCQTAHENLFKSGNAVDYRVGLIARIGLERVEALEANNTPHKWERDELRQIASTYRAKLKELKKERGE